MEWNERTWDKAEHIRRALLDQHVVWSPDPNKLLRDLPKHRAEKWLQLADKYLELFYR